MEIFDAQVVDVRFFHHLKRWLEFELNKTEPGHSQLEQVIAGGPVRFGCTGKRNGRTHTSQSNTATCLS